MTPDDYLNKTAVKYFRRIEKILEKRGQADESFSTILSVFCAEIAKYEDAMKKGVKNGFINEYKNGPSANGYYTISNHAFSNIRQMCGKFGLTPADFTAKQPPKEEGLGKLMKLG